MALGDLDNPVPLKQNDTRPRLRVGVWQGSPSNPVDLTGGTVVFNMRLADPPATVLVNRQAGTVLAGGSVEYTFKASETSSVGFCQGEFEITLADGGILTVPNGSHYIYIQIGDDVA